jgi:hypothetical protein
MLAGLGLRTTNAVPAPSPGAKHAQAPGSPHGSSVALKLAPASVGKHLGHGTRA